MQPFKLPNPKFTKLKNRIHLSFSGGKTSAYMTKMVLDYFREHSPETEIQVVFANTGQEHEETLKFIDRCDKHFGFGVVWIEADVNPERGKGIRHKIVNFETASRNGAPFEAYIAKHGIPNQVFSQCTSRLKVEPMESYSKSRGWKKGEYSVAVGIRADEMARMSFVSMDSGVWYPCIDAGVDKDDVRAWWATQPFNLNIPEHLGNCTWCWKKSNRKLFTIAKEHPEMFEFPARMEEQYGFAGGERRDGEERKRRVFFRGNRTTQDILAAAQQPFEPFHDERFVPYDEDMDAHGSCGDSCEIGADKNDL
jgi:hypothetical protein